MKATPTPSHDFIHPLAEALQWDIGTAFDFIISMRALFHPKDYGLPATWAAGVRKRLSHDNQITLKAFFKPQFSPLTYMPIHLVLEMDQPKTARRFLNYAQAIPDGDFMKRLHLPFAMQTPVTELTERALNGEKMTETNVEEYRRGIERSFVAAMPSAQDVRRLFDDFADPVAAKQRWLKVMWEYFNVFFAEEEPRLQLAMDRMLTNARKLAKTLPVPELIERLSNGFTLSRDVDLERLVLVPSLWSHPYVVRTMISEREMFIAWGGRPPGFRLVPGEMVPENAVLVMRALADPTRLRLLRLIAAEPRALQSLARELKLSLPTVSHHARELRGAGLIGLQVGAHNRESLYAVRWPSAESAFTEIEEFVKGNLNEYERSEAGE